MKLSKRILLFLSLFLSYQVVAQPASIDDVIKWNFSVNYDGCEADVIMSVDQFDGWHVYSQNQPDGAVSFPSEFTFAPSANYELIGKVKEFGANDFNNGGIPERSFHGPKAKFVQRIKIKTNKTFDIKLEYGYMACKESCFPPEFRDKKITIKGCDGASASATTNNTVDEKGNKFLSPTVDENGDEVADSPLSESSKPVKIKVHKAYRDGDNYTLLLDIQVDSNWSIFPFEDAVHNHSTILITGEGIKDQRVTITGARNEITVDGKKYTLIKSKLSVKVIINLFNEADTAKMVHLSMNLTAYNHTNSTISKNQEEIKVDFKLTDALDNENRESKDSLWFVFFIAFGGGFLALLTPCVFPMIPMTVSFFTKQSKTKAEGIRKGILYAFSIIVIYVLLGVIVSATFGSEALNAMSTNVYVNIAFFVLFVIFAISFLGAFEIRLPNSWVNKADSKADKGGLIGIFFMAFTLAMVSFSCTGPILGSVLVQSATGGLLGPIIAMIGFSLALALPFGLFAAFPGWLNSMPQSGGWLNTVKVTLGFLELAFAFKFLSNADLVVQAHLLEREVFLAIWIALFLMLAIYLLGKIRLPHDSPMEKLSVGRALFATAVLAFVLYLIPGMWGAPLKSLSGFPPPLTYAESPYGIHGEAPVKTDQPASAENVHGIWTVKNYDEALAWAKAQGKPLMLDFTGWACVNCRKMENNVWSDEKVLPILRDKFVVASLYVDDRTELPIAEQITLPNGKRIKTIGDKYGQMEINRYKKITQPLYVIVDLNENNLVGEADYDNHGEPEIFKKWLEKGLQQFEESKQTTLIAPNFVLVASK